MVDALTFGFSNRPWEDTVAILKAHEVARVLDIRTLPGSRHAPQYNLEALEVELPKQGIDYIHLKQLGGLRKPDFSLQTNTGWRNASFRAYADYMQTPAFTDALQIAINLMKEKLSAFTCTEAVPWRCHRSLVADALEGRGYTVEDIMSLTARRPHRFTTFASWDGTALTYPAQAEN